MYNSDKKIRACIGLTVTRIVLAGMKKCEESFVPKDPLPGYHENTWGLVLSYEGYEPVVLTWGENGSMGDPFYTEVEDYLSFIRNDTIELQDVSAMAPWSQFIGSALSAVSVLTYESNYSLSGEQRWYSVPWAIELTFDVGPFLVGAMHHGDFETYDVAADEAVIIWDRTLIETVKESRRDLRSKWTKFP